MRRASAGLPETGEPSGAPAPGRTRAALAVWALVVVLCLVYAGELRWAASALPLYLSHQFPPLLERQHAAEALRLADQARDLEGALARMAAAEAIDPNAFPFLHAELERRAGRVDAALAHYERATFVDPSEVRAWLRHSELLAERGRRDEADQVLRAGLGWFSENLLLFQPVPDPAVPPPYNAKAERVYHDLQRGVALLRSALATRSRGRASAGGARSEPPRGSSSR